jgi:hypothetical protein
MRPRFTLDVSCSADHVMESLRAGAEQNPRGIDGSFSARHGVLTLPEADLQFWSTQLGLTIEDAHTGADGAEKPTRVLGVFSPHPEIWTAYVFATGVLTTIAVFGVMWSIVQITLGHVPWALMASLLAVLVGGLAYLSTLVGQGLALGEMYELRSYLDERLDEAQEHTQPPAAIHTAEGAED